MQVSIDKFKRPVNQLTVNELVSIISDDLLRAIPTTGGRGRANSVQKPLSAPCYVYTYAAGRYPWVYWGIFPFNYYAAAGSPACGDVDLELLYIRLKIIDVWLQCARE